MLPYWHHPSLVRTTQLFGSGSPRLQAYLPRGHNRLTPPSHAWDTRGPNSPLRVLVICFSVGLAVTKLMMEVAR